VKRFRVSRLADIDAIERQPYDEVVPFESVYAVIQHAAARFPKRPALTFLRTADPKDAPEVYRYSDLLRKVTQTANLFRSLGVDGDRSVAFLLPSIPEAYLTLLGGETAGRVCAINYLLNAEHIAELINVANTRVLVALGPDAELDIWSKVQSIRSRCRSLEHIVSVGAKAPEALAFDESVERSAADELAFRRAWRRDEIAAYFNTGGTTGAPKLAQHTHGNQIHASWGAALMYDMRETDVIINGFPLFHVAGSFVYGLSSLMSGANIVLPTKLGMRNTAFVRNYWKFVERHRATLLAGVPTVIAALLDTPVAGEDLSSVRCMLTGGSPLPTELANEFEQRFRVPVRNILGMTECAGVVSIIPFHAERVSGSCGLRLPYTEVKAVRLGAGGPLMDEVCAAQEPGVVILRGPNVGPGYTDSKRNAGTFTEDGWLISGDLGYISERGEIHIVGRAKDVIIRSSHNIDPAVIESALLQHPAVALAAAVGAPDEYAGELPVAFVTLKPGEQVSAEEMLKFIEPLISERPAMPKSIGVIESMPLTAIGKIYKPALRLHAVERTIRERVASRFHAASAPRVRAQDAAARVLVSFAFGADVDAEQARQEIKSMMGGFAIDYEVSFEKA
jgi:fatty-acyl-CoA synthase